MPRRPIALVPPVTPDDTLSSWLLRLAANHSSTPHEFCQLIWPQHQFWTRDLDRTISDTLLAKIAADTGLDFAAIRELTYKSFLIRLKFRERRVGMQDGLLPVGIYHRVRRCFGQQYCGQCLRTGYPKLKKLWRFELSISCPIHGSLLQDCCEICGDAFIPHRNNSLLGIKCSKCGNPLGTLTRGHPPTFAAGLEYAVARILEIVSSNSTPPAGSTEIFQRMMAMAKAHSAPDFIDGVRRLCRLAARRSSVAGMSQKYRMWSLMRVEQRISVMETVGVWIADFPEKLSQWAIAHDLTKHYLRTEFGPWPKWVEEAWFGLPASHGPVNVRRRRPKNRLRWLKRKSKTVAGYRRTRAAVLCRPIRSKPRPMEPAR